MPKYGNYLRGGGLKPPAPPPHPILLPMQTSFNSRSLDSASFTVCYSVAILHSGKIWQALNLEISAKMPDF